MESDADNRHHKGKHMGEETENQILVKMESIHKEHAEYLARLQHSVDGTKVHLQKIDNALRGTYEKKGALTRIATLEDSETTRKKITIAAVIAAIGSAASAIVHILKG